MLLLSVGALTTLAIAWLVLGLRGWELVALEAVVIGPLFLADRWAEPTFNKWDRGAQGEETVGVVLEGLAERGWVAIHDISLGRGNVDHVMIGPGGIFAIETKSHRGRIVVDRLNKRWLKQAYAERKLLERITGLRAQALLVFSEAWLVESVPARRDGVTVLPARMLAGYLEHLRVVMSPDEVEDVANRLTTAISAPASVARSL